MQDFVHQPNVQDISAAVEPSFDAAQALATALPNAPPKPKPETVNSPVLLGGSGSRYEAVE